MPFVFFGVAEFRRFGQIRFQSILRVPDFNQQIFHKIVKIGTQSILYFLQFYQLFRKKIDVVQLALNHLCLFVFITEKN